MIFDKIGTIDNRGSLDIEDEIVFAHIIADLIDEHKDEASLSASHYGCNDELFDWDDIVDKLRRYASLYARVRHGEWHSEPIPEELYKPPYKSMKLVLCLDEREGDYYRVAVAGAKGDENDPSTLLWLISAGAGSYTELDIAKSKVLRWMLLNS